MHIWALRRGCAHLPQSGRFAHSKKIGGFICTHTHRYIYIICLHITHTPICAGNGAAVSDRPARVPRCSSLAGLQGSCRLRRRGGGRSGAGGRSEAAGGLGRREVWSGGRSGAAGGLSEAAGGLGQRAVCLRRRAVRQAGDRAPTLLTDLRLTDRCPLPPPPTHKPHNHTHHKHTHRRLISGAAPGWRRGGAGRRTCQCNAAE